MLLFPLKCPLLMCFIHQGPFFCWALFCFVQKSFLKAFLQRYPVPCAQRRNLIVRGSWCWFKKYFAQPRLSSVSGWTVQSARGFPGKPSSFKTSLNGTELGGWSRFLGVCQGGAPISSGKIRPCKVSPSWAAWVWVTWGTLSPVFLSRPSNPSGPQPCFVPGSPK